MTVKVIKKPDPKTCTCPCCKSMLEYEHSDVSRKMTYDYIGPTGYEDFITCPTCYQEVQVS